MIKNDISVTKPLQQSFDRVKYVLFQNFDIVKWFVIGFCAWISLLGESGGLNGANFRSSRNRGSYNSNSLHNIWNFILEHLFIVIGITVIVVIIIIAVSLVIQWLSSRGKFMFLDCTVKNNAAVKEPWSQFKRLANSLFIFRVLFSFATLILFLFVSFISLIIAWPDITGKIFSTNAITSIIVGGLLFLILILVILIIKSIIFDFIIPIMYKKNIAIIEAIHLFRNNLLAGNVKHFVHFYLMKIAIYIAIGVLVLAAFCLTCCIACCILAIPYIGVVVFLPVIMFKRCYSIFFLEQFGDEWKLISGLVD